MIMAGLLFYFGPTFVAAGREHRNAEAIFVLNLLLGWTLIGWVAALVWSLTANTTGAPKVNPTNGSPE